MTDNPPPARPATLWRPGDIVAYEQMRDAAVAAQILLIAHARTGAAGAREARDEAARIRRETLIVDGFDRKAIDAHTRDLATRIAELSASPPSAPAATAGDVFEEEIRPFLFDATTAGRSEPELTLLAGQPGSGRSRAVGQLLAEKQGQVVSLRAADLRPFHAADTTPATVRAWIAAAITAAREQRLSLIIEDAVDSPQAAEAILRSFADDGYQIRLVVPAVPRAESLHAATSRYLRRGDNTDPRRLIEETDLGITATDDLVAAVGVTGRVELLDRAGRHLEHDGVSSATDPVAALRAARIAPLPGRAATEWISELRRITETAASSRPRPGVNAVLGELHRIALTEVVPVLPLPADSAVRAQLDARLRRDLASLSGDAETATVQIQLDTPTGPAPSSR